MFQIQRLLETNSNTDIASPLKIRFTWDPSYWSKQLSNFGKNNIVFFIRQVPKDRQDIHALSPKESSFFFLNRGLGSTCHSPEEMLS